MRRPTKPALSKSSAFHQFEKAALQGGLFVWVEANEDLCHIVCMTTKLAQTAKITATKLLNVAVNELRQAAAAGRNQSMSVKDLESAWAPRFATAEIDELVIPRRTMARRKATSTKLTADEQDRAYRLAQIQLEADRVFGNPEKASRWLRTPNNRLSRQTPLSLLRSAVGADLVAEMLVQIDHGMYV